MSPTTATAAKCIEVSRDLKDLMRRLKLGKLLDTLPERLALAAAQHLPHHDFLEMLFADEVTRRDRQATQLRARAAHLDPAMHLEGWDNTTPVSYDRTLWTELCSLRFVLDSYNVLIMGPVGVGKTFLAHALGHVAIRRRCSVHAERADKLFKRLRAARLDHTHDDELRKLHRIDLLILDDLALHPLDVTDTSDFYERGTPPSSFHDHHLQPGAPGNAHHDGRPTTSPIRPRPPPVGCLRTRHRRPQLPTTPKTHPRQHPTQQHPTLTIPPHYTIITTAHDHRSGPMLMANRWSHHAGKRHPRMCRCRTVHPRR
ncbi:MAG: ATP-binding protein [Pseudonocardiales bacterium]|nr:ATP-binding protein [Pseudonocardiales bacterium]